MTAASTIKQVRSVPKAKAELATFVNYDRKVHCILKHTFMNVTFITETPGYEQ